MGPVASHTPAVSGRKPGAARALLVWLVCFGAPALAQDCHIGTYRLDNGSSVDLGATSSSALRWRNVNGETGRLQRSGKVWISTRGWTDRPDGIRVRLGACESGTIQFDRVRGQRMALVTRDTVFESHKVSLAGRLVLPEQGAAPAIVVLLQGSERDSARDFDALQRLLPALGVGAFVYDKRGTGKSGGVYTQDFWLLAEDAVAALEEARRLSGMPRVRIGYLGPSQGGWVAPIAATRSSPDFVMVTFGLAVSVIDEDREAVDMEMRLKGHAEEDIAKALELADAAETVFASGFSDGIEEFDALRARYRGEPWYPDLHGNFTHMILETPAAEIRARGAEFRWQTPFRYDPRPTIAAVEAPQLWVLGGKDLDAPSGETVRRLRRLIELQRPITVAIYPEAEHGMTEFETAADGSRISTRFARGYFELLASFAGQGDVARNPGDARIIQGSGAKVLQPDNVDHPTHRAETPSYK
jgi:dienelactone hydrolase